MKKICLLVVVALVVAMAGSAMAGLSVSTSGLKKAATEVATTTAAKSALKKYKCTWDPAAKNMKPGCNIAEIAGVYAAQNEVCKQAGGSCTAVINANDYDAYKWVRGKLNLTSTWNIIQGTGSGNDVTFSAQ